MDNLNSFISNCRTPRPDEKVFKDECVFSFDNPESPDGLFISMQTFVGLGKRFVDMYSQKTGDKLFLQYKITKLAKKNEKTTSEAEGAAGKRTKLGIGVEGGFELPQDCYRLEEHYNLVLLPSWTSLPLPAASPLPTQIQQAVDGVIAAQSALIAEELAAGASAWEVEGRKESKFALGLVQLDNGVKVPPSGWQCFKCDLRENLWLNLSDGTIMCGRKFWDGSGGNHHAVDHFEDTGFPLAVKLGTITPQGADVFSYQEDAMVLDPLLPQHLAHFGIDALRMEKTDRTMIEIEIDMNEKFGEWVAIQESASRLEPLYGPGFTGIKNLGNSCYMNSIMQVLFNIPEFKRRYIDPAEEVFKSAGHEAASDFRVQMAKFGYWLAKGEYSCKPPTDFTQLANGDVILPQPGIRPQMFKVLMGRGHPEFSSKRQQDAQEYLLHLLSLIERDVRKNPENGDPTTAFRFQVEDRLQCGVSNKVRYSNRNEFLLSLPIPMEAMTNAAEVTAYREKVAALESEGKKPKPEEIVRPCIPLKACLAAYVTPETVSDFKSPCVPDRKVHAYKSTKLVSCPPILAVHMRKFELGADWLPKKLDVELDVPDTLDLSSLKARGLQPGEEPLPEQGVATPVQIVADETTVQQLVSMGFPAIACKKAVIRTGNTGAESAMNWIMEHMEDPDFAVPIPESAPAVIPPIVVAAPDPEQIAMMMSMGFTHPQSLKALKATQNNLERAADWAFSHMDELDQPDPVEPTPTIAGGSTPSDSVQDGGTRYRLFAFVSHMGTSSQCGHYVCHILQGDRWVIYNDEKVCVSEHPPRHLAYIYFYRRED